MVDRTQLPGLPEASDADDDDLLLKRNSGSGSDERLPVATLFERLVEDYGGASGLLVDNSTNRPSAGVEDLLFLETDTGAVYRDDGSEWNELLRVQSVSPDADSVVVRTDDGRVRSESGGSGDEAVTHDDTSTSADANTVAKRDGSGRVKSESGGSGKAVVTYDDTRDSYLGLPVGVPFPVFDHLNGVDSPSNDGDAKFIRLTAGEDGEGEYNEGLLANESVSGSAPLVEATAEIDYSDSPIYGETTHLINTEKRYVKPGESSGDVADDQMQQITGSFFRDDSGGAGNNAGIVGPSGGTEGAFSKGTAYDDYVTSEVGESYAVDFDSSESPDARTGDHTDVKHIEATWYMRIA